MGGLVGVKVALKDWHYECFVWMDYSHTPGVKQDEQAGLYSSRHQPVNRQAHTYYTVKSTTPRRAAMLVLTDTSQQQLYPKENTEDNNESDAR